MAPFWFVVQLIRTLVRTPAVFAPLAGESHTGRYPPRLMPTERRYDPSAIEPKWQELWRCERTWEVPDDVPRDQSSYVLEMLPYPSGEPHMGHLKNYSVGDAVAHFHRRT